MALLDTLKAAVAAEEARLAGKPAPAAAAPAKTAVAAAAAVAAPAKPSALDDARATLKSIVGGAQAAGIVSAIENLVSEFVKNEVNAFIASKLPAGFSGAVEDVVDGILAKAGEYLEQAIAAEQSKLTA